MNRRQFLMDTSAALSATAFLGGSERLFAAGSQKIRVALIGCGRRGKGAIKDFRQAAEHLGIQTEITAIADFFISQAKLLAQEHGVSEDLCFEGPNAYKKAIATNADVVLLVTPPVFRPLHFEAAVNAGKHVFMEKPAAVDPVGARKIIEAGEIAAQKKLSVVAGTQRRYDERYLKTYDAIQNNAIGPIRGGQVWWCGNIPWENNREPGESDTSYIIRNWISFSEMSGDHIVEQHLHNIDVANWFIGRPPQTALGVGGRARRPTGNEYDFFSVDFDYGDGLHIHSMCRQINGTYNRVSEFFVGSDGATWGSGPGKGKEGFAREVKSPEIKTVGNPYVQEHVELLDSIINGKSLNVSKAVAESTLTAIMGRISAYTGQLVRWKDVTDPKSGSPWYNLQTKPTALDFETGSIALPTEGVFPLPGK